MDPGSREFLWDFQWTQRTHRPKKRFRTWELCVWTGNFKHYIGKILQDETGDVPVLTMEYVEPPFDKLPVQGTIHGVGLDDGRRALMMWFKMHSRAFLAHWLKTQNKGQKKVLTEIQKRLTI